jgi:hypothetical protein
MQGNPPGSPERRWKVCEVADCTKHARQPTLRCKAHGGGMRCVQPGCSKSAVDGYDRCSKDGGGPRCQQEGCSTSARRGYDFCAKHYGGKRCSYPDCIHLARAGADYCGTHGAKKLCRSDGCTKWGSKAGGYCIAHNGGRRCESEACSVYDPPPFARYRSGTLRLCWGCFVALEPDKARLKVRKEHYILSELNNRMPELMGRAREAVWDCRVPGGCSLKRPDMLYVFDDRYVQIEIDELGHADYDCHDEDARLEIISADIGLPGLVVRLNPDEPPCFGRKRLSNGETAVQVKDAKAFGELLSAACGAIETYLSVPPPPSLVRLHFPRAWVRVPTSAEAIGATISDQVTP